MNIDDIVVVDKNKLAKYGTDYQKDVFKTSVNHKRLYRIASFGWNPIIAICTRMGDYHQPTTGDQYARINKTLLRKVGSKDTVLDKNGKIKKVKPWRRNKEE